jgi:hypothetical protein
MSNWTSVKLEGYVLEVDVEKTYDSNLKIPPTNVKCSCDGCQNFTKSIEYAEPRLLEILESLGIELKRASEVMDFGLHEFQYSYLGLYHIVGKIIEHSNDSQNLSQNNKILINDKCSIWFTDICDLVPNDFPIPYFQMNIMVILPRVLDYPYIEKKVPNRDYGKIVCSFVSFYDKKMIRTLTGWKYVLIFYEGLEKITLHVDQEIYDYFKPGWEGKISYLRKSLLGIQL